MTDGRTLPSTEKLVLTKAHAIQVQDKFTFILIIRNLEGPPLKQRRTVKWFVKIRFASNEPKLVEISTIASRTFRQNPLTKLSSPTAFDGGANGRESHLTIECGFIRGRLRRGV